MTYFKFKRMFCLLLVAVLIASLAGCKSKKEPTEVTLWHVYGAQTDSPLNDMIEVFNETVGAEQNIRVKVTSVSNNNTIHENILSAAFAEPGAQAIPDMFVSYPKTVLAMPDESVLVDYNDYFAKKELKEFIPAFVEEGTVHDRLVILPVAKSTEVLFVNKTAFDRFASATGAKLSDLETWEGLYKTAEKYVKWTDEQTADTVGDGKAFFAHDFHFNYFQVGVESLGENFFSDKSLALGNMFEKIWQPYAKAALQGGVWLETGYATEPLRTGDVIAAVASSASVLYFSDTVTYEDNTSEKVDIISLPCPIFDGGKKTVIQRGAGICTVKSTPQKEEACITFLKWLTDAERNVEFVTSLGYMPVKEESFEKYLEPAIKKLEDPMYVSLYQAFQKTQEEYTFYNTPKLDNYLALETNFEENIRLALKYGRAKYLQSGEENLNEQIEASLEYFKTNR